MGELRENPRALYIHKKISARVLRLNPRGLPLEPKVQFPISFSCLENDLSVF